MAEILLQKVSAEHLAKIIQLATSELGTPEPFKPGPSEDELTIWQPNTGQGDERSLLINPSAALVHADGLDEETPLWYYLSGLQVIYPDPDDT